MVYMCRVGWLLLPIPHLSSHINANSLIIHVLRRRLLGDHLIRKLLRSSPRC